jgi:hypothetical protein
MVGKSMLASELIIQVISRLRWRAWGGYSTCDKPPCEHPSAKLADEREKQGKIS